MTKDEKIKWFIEHLDEDKKNWLLDELEDVWFEEGTATPWGLKDDEDDL